MSRLRYDATLTCAVGQPSGTAPSTAFAIGLLHWIAEL